MMTAGDRLRFEYSNINTKLSNVVNVDYGLTIKIDT